MDRIDGEPQELIEYEGKVVLMVNVASRCGLTGQYEPLQALYEAKKDEGFVVLGFPANDFMGQEPGSNEEIAEFCQMNFGVTFPMFAKISVKGDEKHPLYTRLSELPEPMGGEPSWNFTKYLVGRDGKVVRRFDPRTKPDDEAFVAEVERLLATEAPAD
ncbi:MAG: glutathione peroxidase [Planctomycetota bacterium]